MDFFLLRKLTGTLTAQVNSALETLEEKKDREADDTGE